MKFSRLEYQFADTGSEEKRMSLRIKIRRNWEGKGRGERVM